MKANELMIGDYVYNHRDWECPIVEIHKNSAVVIARHYGEEEFLLSNLRPIPLTAEILEKNGFKFQSVCICDNKDAWIWEWPSDKEYELPHCFMLMSHHNKKKYPYFWIYAPNNPDIKYVHELQHALRLCKIKKEIIL